MSSIHQSQFYKHNLVKGLCSDLKWRNTKQSVKYADTNVFDETFSDDLTLTCPNYVDNVFKQTNINDLIYKEGQ